MGFACAHCRRYFSASKGVNIHELHCPVKLGLEQIRIPKVVLPTSSTEHVARHPQSTTPTIFGTNDAYPTSTAEIIDATTLNDDSSIAWRASHASSTRNAVQSTRASVYKVSFEEETGQEAGTATSYPSANAPRSSWSESSKNRYSPFVDEADYALASWFVHNRCSKRAVDRFFKDKRLAKLHSGVSFKSGQEWLTKLNDVPHGIQGGDWQEAVITMDGMAVV